MIQWFALPTEFVLIWMAAQDVRHRQVTRKSLAIASLCALICLPMQIISGRTVNLADTLLLYGLLAVLSKLFKNSIGIADLWVIAMLPLICESRMMWGSLMLAIALIFGVAVGMWFKTRNRNLQLPFLPFLSGGLLLAKGIGL